MTQRCNFTNCHWLTPFIIPPLSYPLLHFTDVPINLPVLLAWSCTELGSTTSFRPHPLALVLPLALISSAALTFSTAPAHFPPRRKLLIKAEVWLVAEVCLHPAPEPGYLHRLQHFTTSASPARKQGMLHTGKPHRHWELPTAVKQGHKDQKFHESGAFMDPYHTEFFQMLSTNSR